MSIYELIAAERLKELTEPGRNFTPEYLDEWFTLDYSPSPTRWENAQLKHLSLS